MYDMHTVYQVRFHRAKGWAGTILFNDDIWSQFKNFYNRDDTFSLGVCNGCQLMALLGWIPNGDTLKSESSERCVALDNYPELKKLCLMCIV